MNPDTPQKPIRVLCLQSHKILLVPQPRLRTGFFSKLLHMEIPPQKVPYAATSEGVKEYGHPLAIDMKEKVDLVVVGSVAVNPANGCRIGKGEGFAEIEYGVLRMMGVISEETPVVTCIHDVQLVDDIPTEKMLPHDVSVNIKE